MITLTLAPVSASKSGARRCSGSAICGPVKVMTLTVTPSNGLSCARAGAPARAHSGGDPRQKYLRPHSCPPMRAAWLPPSCSPVFGVLHGSNRSGRSAANWCSSSSTLPRCACIASAAPVGIARRERVEDGIVLGDRLVVAARRRQEQPAHALRLRARRLHRLGDAAEGQPAEQRGVEAHVERVELLDVAGRDRGRLIADEEPQPVERLVVDVAARAAARSRPPAPRARRPLPRRRSCGCG